MMIISVIVLFATALVTISSCSQKNERPSREAVSNNGWEVSFFPALEERTREVGLPKLEPNVAGATDLELRFWYDAHPNLINGFVIRRTGDVWSARGIRQSQNWWPSPLIQDALGAPKSGWDAFWKKLPNAGILTLPDSYEINCTSGALDGGAYVVEVLTKEGYRTYRYDNPQLGACAEAKIMVSIEAILAHEFTITPSQ
jgi:hypothetical protein